MDGKHVLRADLRQSVLRHVFDGVHVSSASVRLNGRKSEICKAFCQAEVLIKHQINALMTLMVLYSTSSFFSLIFQVQLM